LWPTLILARDIVWKLQCLEAAARPDPASWPCAVHASASAGCLRISLRLAALTCAQLLPPGEAPTAWPGTLSPVLSKSWASPAETTKKRV